MVSISIHLVICISHLPLFVRAPFRRWQNTARKTFDSLAITGLFLIWLWNVVLLHDYDCGASTCCFSCKACPSMNVMVDIIRDNDRLFLYFYYVVLTLRHRWCSTRRLTSNLMIICFGFLQGFTTIHLCTSCFIRISPIVVWNCHWHRVEVSSWILEHSGSMLNVVCEIT